jgi:hypothetical protein
MTRFALRLWSIRMMPLSSEGMSSSSSSRHGRIQVGLDARPQGMELLARQPPFAWACPSQPRAATAQGWLGAAGCSRTPSRSAACSTQCRPDSGRGKVALCAAQAPSGVPTAWAGQPLGVEVTFQPEAADAIVHELGAWKLNPAAIIAHLARWLHMSESLIRHYHFAPATRVTQTSWFWAETI